MCDRNGVIVAMNEKSCLTFAKDGGAALIGSNLYGCHPGASADKLRDLLENCQQNAYTIEKNGVKKLIYQAPWYDEQGQYAGLMELSLEIPFEMPHYIR